MHPNWSIECSPEITPVDEDIEMGAGLDAIPQEQTGVSPQLWRGAEARAYLQERLSGVSEELKHIEQALFDEHKLSYGEKVRADAERKRVEEERVCTSEAMRLIAHAVICLQQMVAELVAEAQEH